MSRALRAAAVAVLAALLASPLELGCGSTKTTVIGPGNQALQFLRPGPYATMAIEVIPVNGRTPDPEATALMLERATEHCQKPGGITLTVDADVATATSGAHAYTEDELLALDSARRKMATSGATIVLVVLSVNGTYQSNPNVVGLTIGGDLVVLFLDTLAALPGPVAVRAQGSILVHELGHVMGLVNETIPMVTPHEDTTHPPHDVSPLCVMFWALEANAGSAANAIPDDYDPLCKQDLRAAGGL
jgi:hypothetical protein